MPSRFGLKLGDYNKKRFKETSKDALDVFKQLLTPKKLQYAQTIVRQKMRYVLLCVVMVWSMGCASRPAEPVVLKNQAITKTQKKEITQEGKRFLVVGTYLNDIDHPHAPKDEKEHFVIALYEGGENPYTEPIKGASLNETPASWTVLEKESPYLSLLPTGNSWGHYYHITAPKSHPDALTLTIEIDPLRQVSLNFQKDPQ
jgi:hypothetical protein